MNGLKLTLKNLTKQYPFVTALDDVSAQFEPGKIYGILGENGAGKSTLMKVMAGVIPFDSGDIVINDQQQVHYDARRAKQLGIAMVHQHFTLVDEMSVVDNVLLANGTKGLFLKRKQACEQIKQMEESYGLKVNVKAKVHALSLGEKQRVEIIKALYRKCRLLILDEPTAVLTPLESKGLFEMLRKVALDGTCVLLISHKLEELFDVCDLMMVMRGGKIVASGETSEFSKESLARLMIGDTYSQTKNMDKITEVRTGQFVRLFVKALSAKDDGKKIANISFQIGEGEIYGIAGVDGNGQSLLIRCLMGIVSKKEGSIVLDGLELTKQSTKAILNHGVSYIPEDCQQMGIVPEMTIEENLILNEFQQLGLQRKSIRKLGIKRISEGDIRAFDGKQLAGTLSGGNQQKLVAARELDKDAKLFVLAHPTRGMDVISAKKIHDKILEKKRAGAAVLLISSDLDEILEFADRIGVMYDGELIDGFLPSQREQIGLAMAMGKECEV